MALKYRCPECRNTFPWTDAANGPERCFAPFSNGTIGCGYSYRDEEDGVISMPNILSARSKSIENVARSVMDSSETRAEMAAEMHGGTAADYSALKITDLNDGRNSEFATKDVSNPVTEVMKAAPGITGFQQNGAAFAAATTQGAYARAGANTVTRISNSHGDRVQAHARSGRTR